jgi:hypothetical protein
MQPRPEDIHLVSPWAPSGVAWLLNALLELGVPIFRDSVRPTWLPSAEGFTLSPHEDDLKRHLPSLSARDHFEFQTDLRLRWSHQWPRVANTSAPIILLVRDPGDALLSLYRRFHSDVSLSEFLSTPTRPMFATKGFEPGLPPADEWALFVMLWHRLMGQRGLLVRFEDLKRQPVVALRPIVQYLGINATDAQLAVAAERSSFEKAHAAEQRFIAERPAMDRFRANLSGKLGGSREAFAADDWHRLHGPAAWAARTLGYHIPEIDHPPHSHPDHSRTATAQAAERWLSADPSRDPACSEVPAAAIGTPTSDASTELARAHCTAATVLTAQLVGDAPLTLRRPVWQTILTVLERRAEHATEASPCVRG